MIKNTFLFSFTVLFLFEIVLRLTYPLYSNYSTEMWRYAGQLKRISSYKNLPHEHVPNRTVHLYGVEIKTNSDGLRAERDYGQVKPTGTKRILVLGDSITMGWGVPFKDTYPALLENMLAKDSPWHFEVINTGVGNYNSACELSTLQRFIKFDPDAVILGFYVNDLEDNLHLSRMGYFLKTHSYLYAFIWSRLVNIKYSLSGIDYRVYYSGLYQNQRFVSQAKSAIAEMIKIAHDRSVPFILVNIPEMHELKNYTFKDAQRFIYEIAREHPEVVFIDLINVLDKAKAKDFWVSPEDPHPNARFHAIIAEAIYKNLQVQKLFLSTGQR